MYTLGHDFMPAGIHAGGLRYHGMAPLISHAYDLGLMEAVAVPQTKVFEAAQLFVADRGHHPGARERRTPSASPSTRRSRPRTRA